MNEHDLICQLLPMLPTNPQTCVGAGDDCAVLDVGTPERLLLFKTDAVVQDVHFTSDAGWERVGQKALSRCLSDIAAMAGTPVSALITLGLPQQFDVAMVESLYKGIRNRAEEFGLSISGGETVRTTEKLFLSVAMVGWIPRHRLLLRKNMQVGDAVFVTGELGGSLAGKHLDFVPRVLEAQWLGEHFPIHAMMDVSDGLASDLRHFITASACGIQLLSEAIPISRAAKVAAKQDGKSPWRHALCDGEDFELLFTLPAAQAVALLDAWRGQFPELKLSCIGKAIPEKEIKIWSRKTGSKKFDIYGYDHFQ